MENMEKISLSEAVIYVKKQLKIREICDIVGISRQCLGQWERGITTKPRKKQAEAFWNLYDELIKGSKIDIFKRSVSKLIAKYKAKWMGDVSLKVEWAKWPEWFVINRLPWLLYDHFYWPNNRKGDLIRGEPFFGMYRKPQPYTEIMIQEAIDQAKRV